MGEDFEWKLALETSPDFITEETGCPVLVFANNGYGDYLFLKQQTSDEPWSAEVFAYYHEGPDIASIPEDLETLLGLKERTPSQDNYPKAIYETGELVELGDRVQIKVWVEFWKGWQDGVVKYVPGISKKNPNHEYEGLKWVAISFKSGEICPLVHPETGKLRKVRFMGRGTL
jgi:hypothetical protein